MRPLKRRSRAIALIAAGLAASILIAAPPAAADRSQARSMVISTYGIVAAEQPLAARAGTAILEKGGNAIDAAVAANRPAEPYARNSDFRATMARRRRRPLQHGVL